MLFALAGAFALSQAFRTVTAMMAGQLQAEFSLSPQQLGVFAATFHLSFGLMQIVMGIGIDLHGVRRTMLFAFPVAVLGALVSALSTRFEWVVAGQAMVGAGCAPAFLVCTVFISREFPAARFAAVSGLVMGIGGLGMLITATPLAWVVQHYSWRVAFEVLAAASALAWLAVFVLAHEAPRSHEAPRESVAVAVREFGTLLKLPHTWGILALASVTYASFITLRGLWLGPLLTDKYGMGLIHSGNVALVVSVVSLFGPPLFGRMDPKGARRRPFIVGMTLSMVAVFVLLTWTANSGIAVGLILLLAFLSGYIVLQYADVRRSYAPATTGRALSLFTMAMFLGIALMQWFTGLAATLATHVGVDPFAAALGATAALLVVGVAAFRFLPAPVAVAG